MDKVGFGERSLISAPDTTLGGAVMKIAVGRQTDTVFHRLHGKIVYVLSGKLRATVMKDGKVNAINVEPGRSFFVKPGLVHNFYAVEESVVIEFASSEMYLDDTYCIFKGTMPEKKEDLKPDDVMKMTEEDVVVEEEPKPVQPKKANKKKTKTKKSKK